MMLNVFSENELFNKYSLQLWWKALWAFAVKTVPINRTMIHSFRKTTLRVRGIYDGLNLDLEQLGINCISPSNKALIHTRLDVGG
ncbi:hypothetical protein Lal_00017103 [Lupinus albus]|nr:hypothetical protein Lal_00017103 [Lupinus albus]